MAKYKVFVTDQRQPSFEIERTILAGGDAELILCNCKTSDDIIAACAEEADAILLDLAPMIENKATVRAAAKKYGISKSTVHTVVTK
jgi:Stage III sporulation protein D.